MITHLKLRAIFRSTTEIIDKHLPDELAIEAQFFGKNVQSMLKLGARKVWPSPQRCSATSVSWSTPRNA
jgi:Holliday junction resolvasome RuvABC endonuclease subunit